MPHETATNVTYGGCASVSLREKFQAGAGERGAVVRASVRLTGRTTNNIDGVFTELAIDNPTTIAGPTPKITSGWVVGGNRPDGTVQTTRGTDGALWAPDGAAVLIVSPDNLIGSDPAQIKLQIAPVVGPGVVFSSAGCWGDKGVKGEPFSGQLAEVPGTQTIESRKGGFELYPYTKFVAIAKDALKD